METTRKILFKLDTTIGIYQSFFDPNWPDIMHGMAAGTKLATSVESLCVNWISAAKAYSLPFQMVHNLVGFEFGFLHGERSIVTRIFDRLAEAIPQQMGSDLSHMKRQKLASVIRNVGEAMHEMSDTIKPTDMQEVFDRLLSGQFGEELKVSIWGAQRTCYAALYFAYENFFTECLGIAKDDEDYHTGRHEEFKKQLAAEFGKDIVDTCFDTPVEVARLARNALAHNGGKETRLLKAQKHDLLVDDEGKIHIVAAHNVNLFNTLKRRAQKLAEMACVMPQLR